MSDQQWMDDFILMLEQVHQPSKSTLFIVPSDRPAGMQSIIRNDRRQSRSGNKNHQRVEWLQDYILVPSSFIKGQYASHNQQHQVSISDGHVIYDGNKRYKILDEQLYYSQQMIGFKILFIHGAISLLMDSDSTVIDGNQQTRKCMKQINDIQDNDQMIQSLVLDCPQIQTLIERMRLELTQHCAAYFHVPGYYADHIANLRKLLLKYQNEFINMTSTSDSDANSFSNNLDSEMLYQLVVFERVVINRQLHAHLFSLYCQEPIIVQIHNNWTDILSNLQAEFQSIKGEELICTKFGFVSSIELSALQPVMDLFKQLQVGNNSKLLQSCGPHHIKHVMQSIVHMIALVVSTENEAIVAADDVLPILSFCIYRTGVCIDVLLKYVQETRLISVNNSGDYNALNDIDPEQQYSLVSFKAASEFVKSLSHLQPSNGISSQTPTRGTMDGGHHGQQQQQNSQHSQSSSTQVSPSSTLRIKSKKDFDELMRARLQQAKEQQSHQQKTQRPQSFLERVKSADEGSYHQE
ncbi:hypothetical protein MP228_003176 [Amoeboaphelidium protococcarum]|nr:hypothetical protein MP228_003176 [Amoeboaphelidium protococcarum]